MDFEMSVDETSITSSSVGVKDLSNSLFFEPVTVSLVVISE